MSAPSSPLPGSATGLTSQIKLDADPSLDLRVTKAADLLPFGDDQKQFYSTGGGELEFAMQTRGGASAPAELINAQLSGTLSALRDHVDFHLTGQVRVTGTNKPLILLSGHAGLNDAPAGDGWHVELKDSAYRLAFDRPGVFPIDLTFAAAVLENGDWSTLDFQMPAGVIVPLMLDGLEAKVKFNPGSTVAPVQGRGFLPADGHFWLWWKPSSEAGEGTLFFTGSEKTDVRVGAGLLRQTSQIALRVLQGKMPGVRLLLDGPGEILSVRRETTCSAGLSSPASRIPRSASSTCGSAGRLKTRARGVHRFAARRPWAVFLVQDGLPLRMTPEGAVRHSGFIRIANDGAVRVEIGNASGVMQLAPGQFPGDRLGDDVRQVFVYRFASADYAYQITADQIVPEVNVSQIATYEIAETDRVINADIELDIREAPLRDWSLSIPADYAVVSVTGNDLADYVPETDATAGGMRNLKLIFDQAHRSGGN